MSNSGLAPWLGRRIYDLRKSDLGDFGHEEHSLLWGLITLSCGSRWLEDYRRRKQKSELTFEIWRLTKPPAIAATSLGETKKRRESNTTGKISSQTKTDLWTKRFSMTVENHKFACSLTNHNRHRVDLDLSEHSPFRARGEGQVVLRVLIG